MRCPHDGVFETGSVSRNPLCRTGGSLSNQTPLFRTAAMTRRSGIPSLVCMRIQIEIQASLAFASAQEDR